MQPIVLYEIDFGYTQYWVTASNPKDALDTLREGLAKNGKETPHSRFYARPVTMEQAASLVFNDTNGVTLAMDVTMNPLPRFLGSSSSISRITPKE